MKKILILISFLVPAVFLQAQNIFPPTGRVGIGTIAPDTSSILQVSSNNLGILTPRMTLSQRNAIASPATGLLIYQTNNKPGFYYYDGAAWTPTTNANSNLSNLSGLTINAALVPAANQLVDVGSSILNWKDLYADSILIDGSALIGNGGSSLYTSVFAGVTNNTTSTGTQNVIMGFNAGRTNTTGYQLTFVGSGSGFWNKTGSRNSFFGFGSGYFNRTGLKNCSYGDGAGNSYSNGYTTSFFGYEAGHGNTAASLNTFIGNASGRSTTIGIQNSFLGSGSGHENMSGASNTFVGFKAGYNTTTNYNTFIGAQSGKANTTPNGNLFVGSYAGLNNTTGYNNVFVGDSTAANNTTASRNTFIGDLVGSDITTGSDNTFAGAGAGSEIATGGNNVFIGSGLEAESSGIFGSIGFGNDLAIDQSSIIQLGNSTITRAGFGRAPDTADVLDFQMTTAKLTTGGAWTNASDRRLKNNFQNLNAQEVLAKVNQLHIQQWHYIADHQLTNHIGPVAQDFYELFKVGDDTTISTIDPSGVALIALQALVEKDKQQDATLGDQDKEIDELKRRIAEMQQSLSECCVSYQNLSEQNKNVNASDAARLEQNVPNPFSSATIIRCYIPAAASSATVTINTLSGNEVRLFSLSGSGVKEIAIDGGSLPAGEYFYSLIVDGRKIETKKMILIE